MSDNSKIEWTEASWNPVTGCDEVSPGCDHCYAKTFAERWRGIPGHHFEQGFDVRLFPERLDIPLRWRKSRRIFVNSMSDLFHDKVPDSFIAEVFGVMALAGQHTFQLLTKRHARMRSLLNQPGFYSAVLSAAGRRDPKAVTSREFSEASIPWPLPNVWLGVSVEDQKWADIRLPALWGTPAAVRWLSCEPLLGSVNLNSAHYLDPSIGKPCGTSLQAIGWVVVGGESGHGARPMELDWARSIVRQCRASGVPVFVKQLGSRWGREHHNIDLFPEELQVREYPAERVAVPS